METRNRQNLQSIMDELESNLQELTGELSGGNTTRDPYRLRELATAVWDKTNEAQGAVAVASYQSVQSTTRLQRAVQDLDESVQGLTGVLPGTNTTPDPSELVERTEAIRRNVQAIRSALKDEERKTEAEEDDTAAIR